MRTVRSGAILAIGVLALSACTGNADGGTSTNPREDTNSTAEVAEAAEITFWVNGGDTPDALREYLIDTFAAENPGSTLVIEEQDWTGLVPRLQTALTSAEQTPDVVEIGNTQTPTFSHAGAFTDLTELHTEVGGDNLLESFVEAGTVDDTVYALPYYSGARAVFYRKDLFDKAGVAVPTTLEELNTAAKTLQEANPGDAANFSGFWFPGQDWLNGLAWINTYGGEVAVQDGDQWDAQLSSPKSQEALVDIQELMTTGSNAPADADANEPWVPFNNAEVAMFSAPTWARWSIDLPECNKGVDPVDESEEANALRGEQQACNEEKTGIFPLPGQEEGTPASVFAGGSNIAIPTMSENQDLAANLVRIIFSEEYQVMLAENGLIPGNTEYAEASGDDVYAEAARNAALDAKLTPAAEKWADVEGARIMEDLFQKLASGADPAEAAAEADRLIEDTLN